MQAQRVSIVEQLKLSAEQRPAAIARGRDIAVVAGAGSGKTRTVVARYLGLLEEGIDVHRVVAITFTQKAAREMRNRVRREINAYLQHDDLDQETRLAWQSRYERLNGARISTIHSLCAEVLRAHPVEAGIDPRFQVLTESEQRRMATETAHQTLAWAATQQELAPPIQAMTPDAVHDLILGALSNRLDSAQALSHCQDPWPIWTRTAMDWLEERFNRADIHAAFENLIAMECDGAIDQAERAGDKLAHPLRELLGAWGRIQQALANSDWPAAIELLPDLRKNMPNCGVAKNWLPFTPKERVGELRAWYDEAFMSIRGKVGEIKVNPNLDRAIAQWLEPLRRMFDHATSEYARAKDELNALDFDDLEDGSLRLLALPAHASILAQWQRQVAALLVDEFQDTNARQRDLITLLNGAHAEASTLLSDRGASAGKLFIVGDGKQSIYRFRGADVTVFRRERQAIQQRGGLACELSTSYRAHAPLIGCLNTLMAGILDEREDPQRLYVEPFAPLQPDRASPATGMSEPHVECHLTIGSKESGAMDVAADALASRLIELVEHGQITLNEEGTERPLNYGDVAILCRNTRSFTYYEDALDRAGIPYITIAGRGFYERPEIRDLLNLLTAIADAGDDLALAGALRSPAFAVTDAAVYALCATRQQVMPQSSLWQVLVMLKAREMAYTIETSPDDCARLTRAHDIVRDLRAQAGRVTVAALLKGLLDATHYRAIMIQAGQSRALRNVDKLLMDAHTSGLVSVGEFLEYVLALRDVSAREGEARAMEEGAVQIMSVHAAKGLEFPIVALGDISTVGGGREKRALFDPELGLLLPHQDETKRSAFIYQLSASREQEQDEQESRRLFYVAATRAQEKLIISTHLGKPGASGALGKQKGWMGWLAAPELLGLEGETIALNESVPQAVSLVRRIKGHALGCYLYPPNQVFPLRTAAVTSAQDDGEAVFEEPALLARCVPSAEVAQEDESEETRELRFWRLGRNEGYSAQVLGQIVHEALAQWRFPGPGFDAWTRAIAQGHGVVHPETLGRLCNRARSLLERLERHPLRQSVESAERRLHEAPFEMWWDGKKQSGRLDILWLDAQGQWHIADVKTDHIAPEVSLADFWAAGAAAYRPQVRRYARAVANWLGQQPLSELILLDYHGHVHIEPVD